MKKRGFSNSFATAGAWSFEIGAFLLGFFPRFLRRFLVSNAGFVFGYLAPAMRNALETNLTRVLNIPGNNVSDLTNRVFRNFALTLNDFFFPNDVTIDVPDRAKLESLRKSGKGVLVLTFHMGHWELGARTMRQWGWPVSAVYQPYQNKKFKEVIESRRAPGVHFIPVGGAAVNGVRKALSRGDMVAMLGDHPFGEEGMAVNMLGHCVLWPKGPIVLAVREEVPIVIAVIVRTGPHQYKGIIDDPLIPQSKTKTEVKRLVQAVADKFGKLVAQYPDQWYRFRPFEFVEEKVPVSRKPKQKTNNFR